MLAVRFHRRGELQRPQTAGTGRDQKLWMVPTPPCHRLGGAREDNRGERLLRLLRRSFQPPPPCLLLLPPPHPSLWRTLNTENLLPYVERCTRHTSCPSNGLRPSNIAPLRRRRGVGPAWSSLLLCPVSCHFRVGKGKSREIKFVATPLGQFW